MITNFRHSTRRETIAAAALLVILSAALLTNPPALLSQQAVPKLTWEELIFSRGPDGVPGEVEAAILQPIYKVEPIYPEAAKAAGISGKVELRVTLDEEGSVLETSVMSGHSILVEAAREAISQWRYDPNMINQLPTTQVSISATVIFLPDGTVDTSNSLFGMYIRSSFRLDSNATGNTGSDTTGQAPVRVGGEVMQGKLMHRVEPIYPEAAKAEGIDGVITLNVLINEDGAVMEIAVVSGPPLLILSAIDAVRQWRYSPTMVDGSPVPVRTEVHVNFRFS